MIKSTYKVKHLFIGLVYLTSMVIGFGMMLEYQSTTTPGAIWFLTNVFLYGIIIAVKGLIWLVKNWNKEISKTQ